MLRRFCAAVLVLGLIAPDACASAAEEPVRDSGGLGGRLFWSALTLVNGVILASSVSDMRLYQSRARDAETSGGDAGEYWDASSREKVMVGLSSASLLVSLAGLRKAFGGGGTAAAVPPEGDFATMPARARDGGAFQVFSLEQRIRYDTLACAGAPPAGVGRDREEEWSVQTGAGADPLDIAFRRALEGAPDGCTGGGEAENAGAGLPSSREGGVFPAPVLSAGGEKEDWTVDSGSEWEAILAARREAGMTAAFPPEEETTPSLPSENDEPETSGAPASPAEDSAAPDDPVADLLRALDESAAALSSPRGGVRPIPGAVARPAPLVAAPPAEEEGIADFAFLPWAVHVSSFQTFARAEKDEAIWTGRGERVMIEEAEIPGKGTWYRVLVGNFADRVEAEAHAASVRSRFGLEYVQVRRRSGL
ncbi:MAG: SPOR domain-containing protein [Candidatus Eisenbacteria bacterium]|nr:SPOR domain-containing protein [Candidatus Eisenbacteria bacterium]